MALTRTLLTKADLLVLGNGTGSPGHADSFPPGGLGLSGFEEYSRVCADIDVPPQSCICNLHQIWQNAFRSCASRSQTLDIGHKPRPPSAAFLVSELTSRGCVTAQHLYEHCSAITHSTTTSDIDRICRIAYTDCKVLTLPPNA